jgi:hypothetical protein
MLLVTLCVASAYAFTAPTAQRAHAQTNLATARRRLSSRAGLPFLAEGPEPASPMVPLSSPAAPALATSLPVFVSAVFVQMLGVGVTLSTLPLMMTNAGMTPTQLGITISCFSGAQMVGCPLLVGLSKKWGKLTVLRACLTGNAIASILTSLASGWSTITAARVLAGLTAASVPVAQVAVADLAPPGPLTSRALSRVSSAASLGIVVGPALGGLAAEVRGWLALPRPLEQPSHSPLTVCSLRCCGWPAAHPERERERARRMDRASPPQLGRRLFAVPSHLEARFVFACSGLLAATVLLATSRVCLAPPAPSGAPSAAAAAGTPDTDTPSGSAAVAARLSQPMVRWIALICSYAVTTGVATYALFSQRFLGYAQQQLSLSQSAAAAAALVAQVRASPVLASHPSLPPRPASHSHPSPEPQPSQPSRPASHSHPGPDPHRD